MKAGTFRSNLGWADEKLNGVANEMSWLIDADYWTEAADVGCWVTTKAEAASCSKESGQPRIKFLACSTAYCGLCEIATAAAATFFFILA